MLRKKNYQKSKGGAFSKKGVQIETRPTWALQKIPPEGCCFWRKQPCSPGRAGLLPPVGTAFCWNTLEGPSGPGFYLHPLFTKYTLFVFFYFFLKCCGTLRIMQQCSFSFRNVVKLYGLRNDGCFEGSEGSKQGPRTDHKYSWTKLGYDSCPSLLIFYWK